MLSNINKSIVHWPLTRKVLIFLFLAFTVFPVATFAIFYVEGKDVALTFVLFLSLVGFVFRKSLIRWMSRILALQYIEDLRAYCQLLKQGDYSQAVRPKWSAKESEFQILKRDMQWMAYRIASREQELQAALEKVKTAQSQVQDSIEYASRIQTSFLSDKKLLDTLLCKNFLIWDQRDVVGGDSYWVCSYGTGFFVGVIDCTGHGVPGAFVTLIIHAFLKRTIKDSQGSPAYILGEINKLMKQTLGQTKKTALSDDGMDCALCYVDKSTETLTFAGAKNSVYILDGEELSCFKGDRCSVGYVRSPDNFVFTDVKVPLKEGMLVYMFSDGLVDQIGGDRRLPFGLKRLKTFIQEHNSVPISAQGELLFDLFEEYRGVEPRRDDMTVLGFEYEK